MSQLKLLVVDDDTVDLMAARRAFAKCDGCYSVSEARDAEAALALLRGDDGVPLRPDFIIVDLNMPRMNGLEFLDALEALPFKIRARVIVLSTSDSKEDRAAAYDRDIVGYVSKHRAGRDLESLRRLIDAYANVVSWPD